MALSELDRLELESLERELRNREVKNKKTVVARDQSTEAKISDRGSKSFGEAFTEFGEKDTKLGKALSGLQIAAMPFQRFEAAIANVALELQSDYTKPANVMKAFEDGRTGKRLGEIGDVYRKAGLPEWASATVGLATTFIPIFKVVGMANKALTKTLGISKFTDKFAKTAGKHLVKGTDDGLKFVGGSLDNAYAPVKNTMVDGIDLIKTFDDAPPTLIRKLETVIGRNIDDIAQNATIDDVRKIKQALGDIRPNVFGLDDLGKPVNYSVKDLNAIYSKTKGFLHDTLVNIGAGKQSKAILAADDAFTATKRASNQIRKLVMHPTTQQPTRGGLVAKSIKRAGDTTTRDSISVLLRAGKEAEKSMFTALSALNWYNRTVAVSEAGGKVLNYAILGGVAGSIGARSASRFGGDDTGSGQQ